MASYRLDPRLTSVSFELLGRLGIDPARGDSTGALLPFLAVPNWCHPSLFPFIVLCEDFWILVLTFLLFLFFVSQASSVYAPVPPTGKSAPPDFFFILSNPP